MGLEEACIQPLTRNFHQQILGAQELSTTMNLTSQPLDQRAEFPASICCSSSGLARLTVANHWAAVSAPRL